MAVSEKPAPKKTAGMTRIRRGKAAKAAGEGNVAISAIVTREQRRKLAIHKAETGQSASSFIREMIDKYL